MNEHQPAPIEVVPSFRQALLPIRGGLRGTFLRKVLGAWRQKCLVVVGRQIILEMARPSCMGVYQSNESMTSKYEVLGRLVLDDCLIA